ncbi:MAG TPA: VCBS repeat-containing protein, partial [Geobacteraceae bacterium]|nr:VCBS repeat-containing protein [Geobacteraceae bacterium]
MNRYLHVFILLLPLLLAVSPCHAAKVKAYVNRFSVSVTENRDELKQSLQTLLMSRLNSDEILAVDSQADADILIEGSYIVFGSVFSLDGLIKTRAGVFIDRVFIQGDSQSE